MPKLSDKMCYLCGKLGADSKDHVPPKCFLPDTNYGAYQRITVPAHRDCNSAASGDEEYLRDLLLQEAEELQLPKSEMLTDKVWRAWSKSGWKRYQRFIERSQLIEKRTATGLYAGKALGITPEINRVNAVCRKIARGIIYHDSGAIIEESALAVAPLTVPDALKERKANPEQHFWIGMSSDSCRHDLCADTVALRRFYEGIPICGGEAPVDQVAIIAHIAIIMWNMFCVCSATFPLKDVGRADFQFAINTQNENWIRGQ